MKDSPKHPLAVWMENQMPPLNQAQAAEKLSVSEPYLSQVLSWKRAVSLNRALDWAEITGLPTSAFRQTAEAAE